MEMNITRTILDMVLPFMLLLVLWALRVVTGFAGNVWRLREPFSADVKNRHLRPMIGLLQNSLQEGGQDWGTALPGQMPHI
jgi:hypothetical protein